MLALTLWRPWTTLIATGIKKIENRPWHPSGRLTPGEWFAVHAGKKWDPSAIEMALRLGVPIETFDGPSDGGVVVAAARYDGYVTDSEDPWFLGPFGWKLSDVIAIPPVPCRGMQGLWALPDDVTTIMRTAIVADGVAALAAKGGG